jgi:hypothetical protein
MDRADAHQRCRVKRAVWRELDTAAMVKSKLFVDRRESTLNEAGDFLYRTKARSPATIFSAKSASFCWEGDKGAQQTMKSRCSSRSD